MATPPPDDRNRRPSLEPTRPATLAIAVLTTTALAWLAISNFYRYFPDLPWLPPLTLLGLAIVEAIQAYATKNRIDRKAGAGPIQPLVVARYAVLAKASALAGALFAGMYVGLASWLFSERNRLVAVPEDLPQAVVGVVGSAALVGAALWLERSCRVPPPPGAASAGEPGGSTRPEEDDVTEAS